MAMNFCIDVKIDLVAELADEDRVIIKIWEFQF